MIMLSKWLDYLVQGTKRDNWRIRNVRLKEVSNQLQIRNAGDTNDAPLKASGITTGLFMLNGVTQSPAQGKVATAVDTSGTTQWFYTAPRHHRLGLDLKRLDNGKIVVAPGIVEANGFTVFKDTYSLLDLATAGHWLTGASEEAASLYIKVYVNLSGVIKLSKQMPQFGLPSNTRVATMQINGSPGLNGTSIVYDNATGAGAVQAGMLLCVYTDSAREQGRGRGSGAGGGYNDLSAALITGINTGTNTITVEAGHNINLTDNDYLAVVPYDSFRYYIDSFGNAWRLLGMIYNDASSNLDANLVTREGIGEYTASDLSLSSTSSTEINSAFRASALFDAGEAADVSFHALFAAPAGFNTYIALNIDDLYTINDSLIQNFIGVPQVKRVQRVLPGTHQLKVYYSVSGSTTTLYTNGAAVLNLKAHALIKAIHWN
jgi:hypothetical protein